jgi:tetratricopeptide (TPR) repeat protein
LPRRGHWRPSCVETAIVLDDQLAEAHVVLGANKLFFDWDFDGAEREFKTAMALDPGYAHPHQLYSYVLRSQSRFDEAIAEAKKAHELDPLDLIVYEDVAAAYRLAGRPGDALEAFRRRSKWIRTLPMFVSRVAWRIRCWEITTSLWRR